MTGVITKTGERHKDRHAHREECCMKTKTHRAERLCGHEGRLELHRHKSRTPKIAVNHQKLTENMALQT